MFSFFILFFVSYFLNKHRHFFKHGTSGKNYVSYIKLCELLKKIMIFMKHINFLYYYDYSSELHKKIKNKLYKKTTQQNQKTNPTKPGNT